MNIIYNFWTKNVVLASLLAIVWYFVMPGSPEIKFLNFLILLEIVTLFLCQLTVYVHYQSNFLVNTGSDGKINSVEQHSLINANSRIYLGVHLFVGLVTIGVYFLNKGF